ncbi:MAG TPA: hypothetical protein VMI09_06515 [Candidatus Binataceae bacterium]|nr:hypothetical protein [Candidatus Binataceae bacterium]
MDPGAIRIRIGIAMNQSCGAAAGYVDWLRSRTKRIVRALESAAAPVVAELRHLNGVGANASSRRDRVRLVKQALAQSKKGPNRCC